MRAAMAAAENVGDDTFMGRIPPSTCWRDGLRRSSGARMRCLCRRARWETRSPFGFWTQPGQEVICESRSHILDWEMATTAVFSGCLVRAVPTERGWLKWEDIEPVIYKRGAFRAATGLIEIENTANLTGGRCTPLSVMQEIWEKAKERRLPVHLDGARIFNASIALSVDVKTLTRGFDTIMFCVCRKVCAHRWDRCWWDPRS